MKRLDWKIKYPLQGKKKKSIILIHYFTWQYVDAVNHAHFLKCLLFKIYLTLLKVRACRESYMLWV